MRRNRAQRNQAKWQSNWGTLLRHINELGLDLQYLIGQGYDGAASMSSERVCVCSVIKTAAPLADYFHCCMHALNLSCSRATKIPAIRHCMDDIKDINNFLQACQKEQLSTNSHCQRTKRTFATAISDPLRNEIRRKT